MILNEWYGELFLPGESKPMTIGSNTALAPESNPVHFLTDYFQQTENRCSDQKQKTTALRLRSRWFFFDVMAQGNRHQNW